MMRMMEFDFSTCPPCRRLASAKLRIKEISRTESLLSSNVAYDHDRGLGARLRIGL
jgi:hypothetical protein